MIRKAISEEYFKWLSDIVNPKGGRGHYDMLLYHLYSTEFYYIIPMDANRAADGEDLRIRFAHEVGYTEHKVKEAISRPCSVLEMITALAIRIEAEIMGEIEIGDETSKWFWGMIVNLGLSDFTDANFNADEVDTIVYRFLERQYEKDGEGGLFYLNHCKRDIRKIEIWYQMCWYLDEILY